MAGTAGKKSRLKVATTVGGAYNVVGGVKSFSHTIDGATVDDSEMGVDWMQRIQGLKDGKISASGNRRLADTNGQNVILSSLLNDSDIFIKALPDNGTTASVGFQQQMLCSKFNEDASVEGAVALSIELEGTGAITLV
jgi:predicted secreted protein